MNLREAGEPTQRKTLPETGVETVAGKAHPRRRGLERKE
jgi:hypothetical protein